MSSFVRLLLAEQRPIPANVFDQLNGSHPNRVTFPSCRITRTFHNVHDGYFANAGIMSNPAITAPFLNQSNDRWYRSD